MIKGLTLFVVILLLFKLSGCGISSIYGPQIDAPVFVKSLICSEEMDIDLNYIAPSGFDKSVENIQISNAPNGMDCVVYGDEKRSDGKYTFATVSIGVNCDYWSEETGIGNDLEINKLLITWSDGSQTTEDVGSITVMGGNMQCSNCINITGHDGINKATYTLTEDTEITGLDCPYQDELSNIICNITINDIPLEDISKDSPIKLKKNDLCIVEYQVNDESKSQYGDVCIRGGLMGKSSKNEEKIATFTFNKIFDPDEDAMDYLKSNL